MLAFGDLAWVPFTYSLQARYLVENDGAQGLLLLGIFALNMIGYTIFRGSNGQIRALPQKAKQLARAPRGMHSEVSSRLLANPFRA